MDMWYMICSVVSDLFHLLDVPFAIGQVANQLQVLKEQRKAPDLFAAMSGSVTEENLAGIDLLATCG